MKSFSEYIEEATSGMSKGWVNAKSGKAHTWSSVEPYHVQFLTNNLSKFRMNDKSVLRVLPTRFDKMDAPDPDESAEQHLAYLRSGEWDIDHPVEFEAMRKGWCRIVMDGGMYTTIGGSDWRSIHAVAKHLDKKNPRSGPRNTKYLELQLFYQGGQRKTQENLKGKQRIELWLDGNQPDPTKIRADKRSDIGRTMAMFREWEELNEGKFGHTLWIDPKGKVYDMNASKEITDPKGHPYTHYDWVAANFTKYFGKKAPDNMGKVVYNAPHEKGWARIRNNSREIDVEVNLSKLNRSQKKTLRDIVDAGPEYGNKGINRPMYIDSWVRNKKSRSGDLGFNNYEEIVDFLSK